MLGLSRQPIREMTIEFSEIFLTDGKDNKIKRKLGKLKNKASEYLKVIYLKFTYLPSKQVVTE